MKKLIILAVVLLVGCSSAQLVSNWKNPDIVLFDAYKVLIVGMTQNEEVRVDFENKLKRQFDKRGIEAVRSIDLFDVKVHFFGKVRRGTQRSRGPIVGKRL